MAELRDPLFLGVEYRNIKKDAKKAPSLSVRVDLSRDDLIYVANKKGRMEVTGFLDPDTGLFVAEPDGTDGPSTYNRFRLKAVAYARDELSVFLSGLGNLSEEDYAKRGYLPLPVLTSQLTQCLVDRQEFYADLQKQVNLIVSRRLPKVNEYLVFEDDTEWDVPVTEKLPYGNPVGYEPAEGELKEVDRFLDAFFDAYNKKAFSWYMGAALSNVPIYDDRVSKLAVLSSTYGGSGKSTLAGAMADALFTPAYRDVRDDFDALFASNNRFGTSSLGTKRLTVYSEASWNADPLSEDHNFAGLNVSAIKSLVTEGYVSSEMKYGDRNMERLSGFHLVLTNYPPVVSKDNEAMNRRMLPLMVKPTSMGTKARELGLWGRQKLDAFVREHAAAFAARFVQVFQSDEYLFFEDDYDYSGYVESIRDAGDELEEKERDDRKKLDVLKADGFLKFLSGLEKARGMNLTVLKDDVQAVLSGGGSAALTEHVKRMDGALYLDASKAFLLRYGNQAALLRRELCGYYGDPVKKCHRRMFVIPVA